MINETISLQDQSLVVDLAARRVWQGDGEVELTRLEAASIE